MGFLDTAAAQLPQISLGKEVQQKVWDKDRRNHLKNLSSKIVFYHFDLFVSNSSCHKKININSFKNLFRIVIAQKWENLEVAVPEIFVQVFKHTSVILSKMQTKTKTESRPSRKLLIHHGDWCKNWAIWFYCLSFSVHIQTYIFHVFLFMVSML